MGVRKTNCRGRLTTSGTIAGSLPQLANMLTIQELQTRKRNTRINIVPDKKNWPTFSENLSLQELAAQHVEFERVVGRATFSARVLRTKRHFLAQVTNPQVFVNAS